MSLSGRGRKKGSGARAGSGAPAGLRVIQALSDPSRWRLVEALVFEDRTVTELAVALGLSVPCTSHHISILKEVGVLSVQRDGRSLRCRLSDRATSIGEFVRAARSLAASIPYQSNYGAEATAGHPGSDAVPEFAETPFQKAARTATSSIPMEDFLL
jgi:DNA-binding transcriptional ArsR family regulator